MDNNLRIIATPIAGLLMLASLVACDSGDPAPTETPTPTPTVVTPSPMPTPTPTGPVPAPDDPSWTENQLAAVRAVDAYNEMLTSFWNDPANADFMLFTQVVVDPQYTEDVVTLIRLVDRDWRYVGKPVTPVFRDVQPEADVEGVPEIRVRQCEEDDPDSYVIEQGVERPVRGNDRVEYIYTVQWQADFGVWKVALVEKGRETC
jgi:hypothetical protein